MNKVDNNGPELHRSAAEPQPEPSSGCSDACDSSVADPGRAGAGRPRPPARAGAARCWSSTHGAGGGVDAADLLAVRDAALQAGIAVARITQPYRVAGRSAPAPAPPSWTRPGWPRSRRCAGGAGCAGCRSSSAAARTARGSPAAPRRRRARSAVVALAFPLHPPGRPEKTRLAELRCRGVPVLVVQGDRDAFGMPPAGAGREIVVIAGADHSLKRELGRVAAAVADFVTTIAGRASVG